MIIDRIEWPGPFCYKVTSGRIKLGQRYYEKGNLIYLNEDLANSLYPSGQLEYVKTLHFDKKRRWALAAGENIDKLGKKQLTKLPLGIIRNLALRRIGEVNGIKRQLINKIVRAKWLTAQQQT